MRRQPEEVAYETAARLYREHVEQMADLRGASGATRWAHLPDIEQQHQHVLDIARFLAGQVEHDEPEQMGDSQLDALVSDGPHPQERPIGFWPTSDPTRHPNPED